MPEFDEIYELITEACIQRCSKAPETVSDCLGVNDVGCPPTKTYVCEIRRLSDNISFAQEMNWLHIVYGYYLELLEVTKDAKTDTSNC